MTLTEGKQHLSTTAYMAVCLATLVARLTPLHLSPQLPVHRLQVPSQPRVLGMTTMLIVAR